jgi:hypothetical protein
MIELGVDILWGLSNEVENRKLVNDFGGIDFVKKIFEKYCTDETNDIIVLNCISTLCCYSYEDENKILMKDLNFKFLENFSRNFTICMMSLNFVFSLCLNDVVRKKIMDEKVFEFFLEYFNSFKIVEFGLIIFGLDVKVNFFLEDFNMYLMFVKKFANDGLIYKVLIYNLIFFEKLKKFENFKYDEESKIVFKKNEKLEEMKDINNIFFNLLKQNNKF